jgi:glycosyltransferase involved in cell wall biosynthesis
VRDEEASISAFAEAVARQSRPPDEIVIVDGGSRDRTLERLSEVIDADPRWRVIEAPGTNISQGRNIAVAAASHPIIAVTDGGAVAADDWLERLIEPLTSPDIDVASGFFSAGGSTPFSRSLGTLILPHAGEIDPEAFLPSSRSVAFRRHVFERVGGYPEWLPHCEDLVLDLALKDAGARFAFVPDAVVRWDARPTLRAFARQYYLYARGDGIAGLWLGRHLARYGAYAAGCVLVLASRRSTWAGVVLTLGIGVHLRRYLHRVARSATRGRDRLVTYMLAPVVLVVGDVAKMLGFPVGLVRRRAYRPSA